MCFLVVGWYDWSVIQLSMFIYLLHFPFLQVVRATNMIKSAMRFKLSLDETLLEPDVFHLKPKTSDTQWFRNVIR